MFVARGVLIAVTTQPYSGHDEIAHYAYLKVLVEEGRLPLIPDLGEWRASHASGDGSFDEIPDEFYPWAGHFTTPDWDRDLAQVPRSTMQDGELYPSGWIYTANHPPLYYLLLTPVYHLVDHLEPAQQVMMLRIATVPFGALTVLFAYLTVRAIFPRDRFLMMLVPAFVAMQPQIAYEGSILNNDTLAITFVSATFWMLAEGLRRRFPWWTCMLTGLFFGLAMLSKSTSVAISLLIAFTMILGVGWRFWREWIAKGVVTAAIGGVVVAPWLLFMMRTYGDPTALNRVSELQSWWNDDPDRTTSIIAMLTDRSFFWGRWKETWGDFGWRLIELDGLMAEYYGIGPFNPTLLRVLLWITIVATIGVAVWFVRMLLISRRLDRQPEYVLVADPALSVTAWQIVAILACVFACMLGYYSVLQFGTTFALTQARYYFPMVVPAAVLFMLGMRSLVPRKWHPLLGAGLFVMMVVLNIIIYTGYVLAYWHPQAGA